VILVKNETKICAKCVLPEVKPQITLDSSGICNICNEYQKVESVPRLLESDFIKVLDKYRGKHKYDCLVMCSGGKDSTAALYFMKERYKLNPLAFMFDHGFETKDAINNVKKAVDKLGVDFLFFKTNEMKNLFKKIVENKSKAVICHPCSIWYMQLAFDVAKRNDCPIIIAGWTKGQSTRQDVMSTCGCNVHNPEYKDMAKETTTFLNTVLKGSPEYKDFPKSMEELLKKIKKNKQKTIVLSPHWFLPYTPDQYVAIIKEKLDWDFTKVSYPSKSTNCMMNFVSVHNSMKYFGYTHYHVEMSKLIREGVMSREDALLKLKMEFSDDLLSNVLKRIDCKLEDIK